MSQQLPFALLIVTLAAGVAGCSGDGRQVCTNDNDCPSGRYCNPTTGDCVFDCTYDSDCPGDQQCTARGQCGCEMTHGGLERCDNVDNDCDGETDEEITGEACSNQNQYGHCAGVERCRNGAFDCDAPVPAPEDCDQVDNDCDGETDEGLASVVCPLNQGVCTGVMRTCQAQQGWSDCDYGSDYQEEELACDLLDNDCDGNTDEDLNGGTCQHQNEYGSCEGQSICRDGEWFCNALVPAAETCDQIDNDCDGLTDEDVPPTNNCEIGVLASDLLDNNCDGLTDEPGGCMVRVRLAEIDVLIDVYENSVYADWNCTGTRYGIIDDYPGTWPPWADANAMTLYGCSLPGVQPSAHITQVRARRACQAQGKRLCTKAEWSAACGGPDQHTFTYGDTWQPNLCNDASESTPGTTETGSWEACRSLAGTYDMSGNLWEFVEDACSEDPSMAAIQGGPHDCTYCDPPDNCVPCDGNNPEHLYYIEARYACHYPDGEIWCALPATPFPNFGFRCCLDP